uniref:Uncharacterized protein n=1 Tax=Nelumbo nucifera TaxID=4432 RepID=A0A822Y4V9_NELNU|nr:TPA_asm: hypothetical protein HUJ06_028761 [Nelumbo nucifera]
MAGNSGQVHEDDKPIEQKSSIEVGDLQKYSNMKEGEGESREDTKHNIDTDAGAEFIRRVSWVLLKIIAVT